MAFLYLFCLLVNQSSDIELNPGPVRNPPQYPYGKCDLEVSWSEKAICCDSCDRWFHTDCQGIGNSTYARLSDSKFSWHCQCCGSCNHSLSVGASLDSLSDTNIYCNLESPARSHANDASLEHVGSFLNTSGPNLDHHPPPQATSTPKSKVTPPNPKPRASTKPKKAPISKNQCITVLNINCRSIKNKVPELHQMINQVKPDVICCSETWLKPDIHTAEIFPDSLGYAVYRDDRTHSQGGGVLIAVTRSLLSQEQPDLKTDCNVCWAKLSIPGSRNIYVGSFYKPHENDPNALSQLWSSLQKIPKNSIIWLAGDFNMPDIDWSSEAIKNSCKFKTLYEDFLENIVSLNLEQMVKIPTRNNNILDLPLTNVPSLVHNVKSLPSLGNSDHDIIFHEFNIKRGRPLHYRKCPKSCG